MNRADYEEYLKAKARILSIEEELSKLAQQIVLALREGEARYFHFGDKDVVWSRELGEVSPDGSFSVELLLNPDWKAAVAIMIARKEQQHREWIQRCDLQRQREMDAHDFAELKRLKEKYPNLFSAAAASS